MYVINNTFNVERQGPILLYVHLQLKASMHVLYLLTIYFNYLFQVLGGHGFAFVCKTSTLEKGNYSLTLMPNYSLTP